MDDKAVAVWSDRTPLTGGEAPRLWAAATSCVPLEIHDRLLDFSEEQSRKDLERCHARVHAVSTSRR